MQSWILQHMMRGWGKDNFAAHEGSTWEGERAAHDEGGGENFTAHGRGKEQHMMREKGGEKMNLT